MQPTVTHTLKYGDQEDLVEYFDSNNWRHLGPIRQAYGVCFSQDKVLLVQAKDGNWGLPGGTIEPGESVEACLKREIIEESNYRVVKFGEIGFQRVTNKQVYYQVRFACIVEKLGEFTEDGDGNGSIVAAQLFSVDEAKRRWNWGRVSEILLQRALEWKQSQT
ncbi:NUDIX hydrolase domain-like protein [Gorgonomyces haynaldii]|nr:NUDIX hydrolase domain-like protein [Gorgonomyces haynaldii]